MKTQEEISKIPCLEVRDTGEDGGAGLIMLGLDERRPYKKAVVIWSWGDGWDHVSMSYKDRVPTWDEMCKLKDLFFLPEETCVEYHPAKSQYVNIHPYCLHIWRRQDDYMPRPPMYMV